ncbi:helix-turn-helix domain-containing protein [Streptomyces solaniscabiei]|uniref:helix-turn-helix domain-containing protein n=1 Tax=Streptomyces solaniscabiei TaxID=2683255 RepID=UPI0027E2152F|nr:helix-turn-helix domain-containing protein [Streptomyces solaniscabiei]
MRRAADLLHLHHGSVARRLQQIGGTLGIELTEPAGLLRARLALAAWRLLGDRDTAPVRHGPRDQLCPYTARTTGSPRRGVPARTGREKRWHPDRTAWAFWCSTA